MFNSKLTAVGMAAVIATGLVAATDLALSRSEPSAAATVSARFPTRSEMLLALDSNPPAVTRAGEVDRNLVPAPACVREHWPYIADECLTASNGGSVKPPSRTITIERPVAGDTGHPVRLSQATIR